MYEQEKKPKEKKSKAVANTVSQKKSDMKQTFGFVDNGEILPSKNTNSAGAECYQRKITNFRSTATEVDSPLEAYLSQITSSTDYGLNEKGDSVDDALAERLPDTDNTINQISSVTGTYTNDGGSVFKRNNTISGKIGRAGRQQALLNLGQEPYYQGGHLISHSMLGQRSAQSTADKVDGWENIMAMSADVNNITYKAIETEVKKRAGPTDLKIVVKRPGGRVTVPHEQVAYLTGCQITNASLRGEYVTIPNVIADEVDVYSGESSPDTAEEIPSTQSISNPINTGKKLMQYLEERNIHYSMGKELIAAVKKL